MRSEIHRLIRLPLSLFIFVCVMTTAMAATAKEPYDESQMRYIDNGTVRLGVNLGLGGAITFVGDSKTGKNLINNYDWGRQIQMSFFAEPRPYIENGQEPKKHWEHIGWNPIQAGDDYGNGSKVIAVEKTDTSLYVKCIPMQWPLNNVPGECTYECWIELEDNTVQVRCRLNNARSEKTKYVGRHQELPAVYTNGEFYRLMTYRGDKPFTGDTLTRIQKKRDGGFPWTYWLATENWAALVNDNDWGLGIYKPDNFLFIGGFAGDEGHGGTHDSPTGYISPLHTEILDHNITYDYDYVLILGSLDDIRGYAVEHGERAALPDWRFENDRQHWHYRIIDGAGTDTPADAGWPITEYLELDLATDGIAAISPTTFWEAEAAPVLYIDCAFNTSQNTSRIAWTPYTADNIHYTFNAETSIAFPIIGDGTFRTYAVDLSAAPNYRGSLSYLTFKPIENAEEDAWVKVKRISIEKQR